MNSCSYTVTKIDNDIKIMEVTYELNGSQVLVSMPLPSVNETLDQVAKKHMPSFDNVSQPKEYLDIEENTTGTLIADYTDAEFDEAFANALAGIPKADLRSVKKILDLEKKYIKTIPFYSKTGTLLGIEFVMPQPQFITNTIGATLLLETDRILNYAKSIGVFCIAIDTKEKSEEFFSRYSDITILKRFDGYRIIYTEWTPLMEEAKLNELKNNIRAERNELLLKTDYIFNPDVSVVNESEWLIYRQELRDIPQQEGFPENVTWPNKP